MAKKVLVCSNCGEEAFAEGDCPNELKQSSGFIHGKNDNDWFCSEKCKKGMR